MRQNIRRDHEQRIELITTIISFQTISFMVAIPSKIVIMVMAIQFVVEYLNVRLDTVITEPSDTLGVLVKILSKHGCTDSNLVIN